MAPLTSPISTQRFEVCMLHARQMIDSKPPASSDEAFEAFVSVWMALMVATGWPLAQSLETLRSTTASTVWWRWRASVKGASLTLQLVSASLAAPNHWWLVWHLWGGARCLGTTLGQDLVQTDASLALAQWHSQRAGMQHCLNLTTENMTQWCREVAVQSE